MKERPILSSESEVKRGSKIGIIGWGVVGQATGLGFAIRPENQLLWYDKYKEGPFSLAGLTRESEFIFVCVPTPVFSDESGIDLSAVEEVVSAVAPRIKNTNQVLVIKSSVVPGTTRQLAEKYPTSKFAMCPEFLTERNARWDFLHPDRVIIGVFEDEVGKRLERLHKDLLGKEVKVFITDSTSAELAKYMSNLMLASKALLANEFYGLAQALGVEYERIRWMVEADPRIGTHLRVPGPDGDFGFGGKCFPKDMMALLALGREFKVDMSVLEAIWKKNLRVRKNYDWEEIPGAVNHKGEVRELEKTVGIKEVR